jgi:hypothetical protein
MLGSRNGVWTTIALVAAALMIWAWVDGGEREVHPISQEVSVPEQSK